MLKLPAPGSLIRMPPSVTIFFYIPLSFKDGRYDLVLILAIETVERSMSDLGISTSSSLESVCQNLCLLKLLKQNINLFKDNLTNSAVVKEGAEEACPVQTTEMVTLEGILANSRITQTTATTQTLDPNLDLVLLQSLFVNVFQLLSLQPHKHLCVLCCVKLAVTPYILYI